jgi:hypothetical protein
LVTEDCSGGMKDKDWTFEKRNAERGAERR